MRHCSESYLFPGAFAPVLSLDSLRASVESDAEGTSFELNDAEPLADERVERGEARRAVASFVASLSARDREIVRRIFWDEESQTEVATSFKVSKMAISKAVARICSRGRDALAEYKYLAPMS